MDMFQLHLIKKTFMNLSMEWMCNAVDFFEKSSTKEVERLMEQRFSSWKKEDSDAFFKVDPSSPWFDDEISAP